MNLIETWKKTQSLGKWMFVGLLLVELLSVSFAAPAGVTAISSSLSSLCVGVKGFLGIAIFLMIILAAVTYAVGQIMGAETRARATVWATAMFTGAIFAGIIYLIVPWFVRQIISGSGVIVDC